MGPMMQRSRVSGQGNGCGRDRGKSWVAAADRFIMGLLTLGVCLSQDSWLVKRGKVNLYLGDRLVPLSTGDFLSSASWGLEGGRGRVMKEHLRAVSYTSSGASLQEAGARIAGLRGLAGPIRVSDAQGWDGAQELTF